MHKCIKGFILGENKREEIQKDYDQLAMEILIKGRVSETEYCKNNDIIRYLTDNLGEEYVKEFIITRSIEGFELNSILLKLARINMEREILQWIEK